MAKSQSFADKAAKGSRKDVKKMAKLVISQKKANGNYSFKTRMVSTDDVKGAIADAKS